MEDIEKFIPTSTALRSKQSISSAAQATASVQPTKIIVNQTQTDIIASQGANPKSLLAQAHRAFENRNYIQAFEIYSQLANAGNADAQALAGEMLWYGDGIASNPNTATTLLSKAAAQGHVKAKEFLKLFAERKNRQAELDFYINTFDGGSLKWTTKTCEDAGNKATQTKNTEINTILECYNNYIASIKQGLESGSYLPADINQIMRVEELEKSKQLARTVLFKQGLEAKSYVEHRLASMDKQDNHVNDHHLDALQRKLDILSSMSRSSGWTMADGSPVPNINRASRYW